MNEDGSVTGFFTDANGNQSSFLRKPNGDITTFSAPNAQSTIASGINALGAIAGYDNIPDPNNPYGDSYSFLRNPNGKLTTFDGNGEPSCSQGIYASAVNIVDSTTGVCLDQNYNYHGFYRSLDGELSIFDIPNPSENSGPQPVAINDLGDVVGSYSDVNQAHHAFLWHPSELDSLHLSPKIR
jgi:probable HAF family extracellular repeat protein